MDLLDRYWAQRVLAVAAFGVRTVLGAAGEEAAAVGVAAGVVGGSAVVVAVVWRALVRFEEGVGDVPMVAGGWSVDQGMNMKLSERSRVEIGDDERCCS